jgi:hypothetical protein
VIAGDVEARMNELRSAAVAAAGATVIALDRLMVADRVCMALLAYTVSDEGWDEVEAALAAWEASRPS